jgi:hypothetical protein
MRQNKEQGASQRPMGPQIILRSPQEGVKMTCPLDLDIQFESSNGAAVDVNSLRVHVRKVWDFDITKHVRPYATPEGIRMTNATFPRGRHTITLTIADHDGGMCSRTITVEIV